MHCHATQSFLLSPLEQRKAQGLDGIAGFTIDKAQGIEKFVTVTDDIFHRLCNGCKMGRVVVVFGMAKYNGLSRKLKAAKITGTLSKQKVEPVKEIPGAPKKRHPGSKALVLSQDALLQMAKDRAGGSSMDELADKYSLSKGYVESALRTLFTNSAVGRDILKGVMLENAIATSMRVRETVGQLQPMQAVIASGITTQRFIDLEKHTANTPPEVDFAQLARVGDVLAQLGKELGIDPDSSEGEVIDIDADVSPGSKKGSD